MKIALMDEVDKGSSADETLNQIDAALEDDPRKIGDVWRSQKMGRDVAAIATEMNWASPGPVYSYRTYINVLRGMTEPPMKPTIALQCGRQIASFIRRHPQLSSEARELLNGRRQRCESNVEEYEELEATTSDDDTDEGDNAGVYVYTLPHYIHHPVSGKPDARSTPRTLLKVGKSDIDIEVRIKQQTTTALPERPIKLRIYQGDDEPTEIEKRIHTMLDAADHNPNREKGAGKEWFLTNLKFLDAIAVTLGLQIRRYNEDMTTELET